MSYSIDDSKIPDKKFKSLKVLYRSMPITNGCECCENINKDNAEWCCKQLNPSMFYVEFLYIWLKVKLWEKQKRVNLILRAISNYLNNSIWKGCIFFDDGCLCYDRRPLYCRLYALIPDDSWNKKVELLKSRYGNDFYVKQQCNLVSTVDGTIITSELENKWFDAVKTEEQKIGIPDIIINMMDAPGGSYRTFHDHLLLELFDEEFLEMLTKSRISNPSKENIKKTIDIVEGIIEENDLV